MTVVNLGGEAFALRNPTVEYEDVILPEDVTAWVVGQVEATVLARHQSPHVPRWTAGGSPLELPHNRALRDRALARLAGMPVVDLGCGGPESTDPFQAFIKPFNPKLYVGVNHVATYGYRPWHEVPQFGIVTPFSADYGDPLPGAIVRGDMLRVLSRLPDNSISIALNGIDRAILPPDLPYGKAVAAEITRVAHPEGLVFGVTLNGGILSTLAEAESFTGAAVPIEIANTTAADGFYFLQKVAA
ncbi:MAG TPA: hypothetical protein VLF69_04105 [Candidatus Saccharimonadales bacterium]|nr:hypothetical protein [Candidatus Saccharimonadales bacterium]